MLSAQHVPLFFMVLVDSVGNVLRGQYSAGVICPLSQ